LLQVIFLIDNLRSLDADRFIETDVCLVGSGPAGWTIAEELRGSGLRVLLVESGGLDPTPDVSLHHAIEDVGVPLINGRDRGLGGTSNTWSGRLAPLDAIDYEARAWIPNSGWPFGPDELEPYLSRASGHLGGGSYDFAEAPRGEDGVMPVPELSASGLGMASWQETGSVRIGHRLRSSDNPDLRVLVNATVTHLTTDASGAHLESVEITDGFKRAVVRARATVLCAGGIENAHILLCSNRILAAGIGNAHDLVGRYFMDHPKGPGYFVRFDLRDAAKIYALLGPHRVRDVDASLVITNGFAFAPERQRRDGLLNCAAWPVGTVAVDDPVDALKRIAGGSRAMLDRRAIVGNPKEVSRAVRSLIARRHVRRKLDALGLVATSEQRPDPQSRITLSEHRDALGRPMARIDWRIGRQEIDSQAALAEAIVATTARLGFRDAWVAPWTMSRRLEGESFIDSCHPTGTTRMSDSPRSGVVDRDLRLHGMTGLYIAGSSVFPTGGHANPTLTIVALAMRLGRHLKRELTASGTSLVAAEAMVPDCVPLGETASGSPAVEAGTTVAVTGATGFIGGRLVETLVARGMSVICPIRDAASGERVERAGGSPRALDLTDPYAVRAALVGVDTIFHCAYDWQDESWNLAALRALIDACKVNRCRRLVLLSSFVVYDLPRDGVVTEETFAERSGGGYAFTKRALEGLLLRAVREDGLPGTILQPTIVYGPRAHGWTEEPADRLRYGTVVLPAPDDGICNAVYVDDVVHAIILSADAPAAIGQRYLISGPDEPTWGAFYERLAGEIGVGGPTYRAPADIVRAGSRSRKLLAFALDPARAFGKLSKSGLARKIVRIASAVFPDSTARLMESLSIPDSRRPKFVHVPSPGQMRFLQNRATIGSEKARLDLGYAPEYGLAAGMKVTGEYLRLTVA